MSFETDSEKLQSNLYHPVPAIPGEIIVLQGFGEEP